MQIQENALRSAFKININNSFHAGWCRIEMTKKRKRLLIAISVVLGVIFVLGALFQDTTRRALDRAEALKFRRMLVTKSGDKGDYRFFYASNRRPERSDGDIENRFGIERVSNLNFGLFDTDIEPSLGVGMLIDPTDWFQNEEIKLREVRGLNKADFVKEIRSQVENSPYNSLLLNIQGFRERFPSALRKTAFLAHILDINTPLIVFDWPGNQGSSLAGYRRAQKIATESGVELAKVIDLIIRDIRPKRLWLMANSMGAEVVVSAFSKLFQNVDYADAETEIEEVILSAPDISHEKFGRQFKPEIISLTRNLTVYVSSNDRALLISRVLNWERRLGESTINPKNPDQLEEAWEAFQLVEPNSERVTLVDVTPVNRTRNFHSFSLETPEFFDDLYLRFTNVDVPQSRSQYRFRTSNGSQYWILTRGR